MRSAQGSCRKAIRPTTEEGAKRRRKNRGPLSSAWSASARDGANACPLFEPLWTGLSCFLASRSIDDGPRPQSHDQQIHPPGIDRSAKDSLCLSIDGFQRFGPGRDPAAPAIVQSIGDRGTPAKKQACFVLVSFFSASVHSACLPSLCSSLWPSLYTMRTMVDLAPSH